MNIFNYCIISVFLHGCIQSTNTTIQKSSDIEKYVNFEIKNKVFVDSLPFNRYYADIVLNFDTIVLIENIKQFVYHLALKDTLVKADIFIGNEGLLLKKELGLKYLGDHFGELEELPYKDLVKINKHYFGCLDFKNNINFAEMNQDKVIREFTPLPIDIPIKKLP